MAKEMILIDGSMGEGGGQIVRSSLALSLITDRPVVIKNIRANRPKPGLLRQHLTAVSAAAEISSAEVKGAELGSRELVFIPGKIKPGTYRFSIGTAGSTTLVLQTILPALMISESNSELTLEGGTHNPLAPSYDFLDRAFLPLVRKMGPKISTVLERPGYYPAGGGRLRVNIEPSRKLEPLEILERGEIKQYGARAIVCRLSPNIARRELNTVKSKLNWDEQALELIEDRESRGPGNALIIDLRFQHGTEVFTGFGEKGVPAEKVAERTVLEVLEYLTSGAPVGKHLADQLLLPLAMSGEGAFRTMEPTRHTLTNIEVIKKFLDLDIRCEKSGERIWQVVFGYPSS